MASAADVEHHWGIPTATIDWCEANYVLCKYIAEFWNTLSNVGMIVLALWGLYQCRKAKLEGRIVFSFYSLLLVGIGSWCFHGSLLYSMQLLDEMPMIYGTCVFLYTVWEDTKEGRHSLLLILLLSLCAVVFSYVYMFVERNPVFHEVCYAILVAFLIVKFIAGVFDKGLDEAERRNGSARKGKSSLRKFLFILALVTYGTGFALWNFENAFCPYLRAIRSAFGGSVGVHEALDGPHSHPALSELFPFVGSPEFLRFLDSVPVPLKAVFGLLAPFFVPALELHAWWHLLTGYGTYVQIVLAAYHRTLRREQWGKQPVGKVRVKWWLIFPYIAKKRRD